VILDATAGNRSMYVNKHSDNIVYIDRQVRLEVKPTVFCDSRHMPFKPKQFHTIFYDPPHIVGSKRSIYSFPDIESYRQVFKDNRKAPVYYGVEQYSNVESLIKYIYETEKELRRVLADDGLLWLKWNESNIPLFKILAMFKEWRVLMKINVCSPKQTRGKKRTYWICMEKKNGLDSPTSRTSSRDSGTVPQAR